MVAGVLARLGVRMDYTLGQPDIYAPKGYFESGDAHAINTKIFQLAWKNQVKFEIDPHFYPPAYEEVLAQAAHVERDIQEFAARFRDVPLWGFKNPKTSLTVELFLPHLPHPHLVVTLRNPLANAEAFNKIYGLPLEQALSITTYYNFVLAAICNRTPYPKLFIDFESARRNPEQLIHRLAEFLALKVDAATFERAADMVVGQQPSP